MIGLKELCEKKHTKYKKSMKLKNLEKRLKSGIVKYNHNLLLIFQKYEEVIENPKTSKNFQKLCLAQIKKCLLYNR